MNPGLIADRQSLSTICLTDLSRPFNSHWFARLRTISGKFRLFRESWPFFHRWYALSSVGGP